MQDGKSTTVWLWKYSIKLAALARGLNYCYVARTGADVGLTAYPGRLCFPDGRTKIYRASGDCEPDIHLDSEQSTVIVRALDVDYTTEVGSPMS